MAKFDLNYGGRLSGLLGNVVVAGNNLRIRQDERKKDSWSTAQKIHRLRYSGVIQLYRELKFAIVEPIWRPAAKKGITPYNLFIKENLKAFGNDGKIKDPTMLKMAIGNLPQPFNIKAEIDAGDPSKVNLSWENNVMEDIDRYADKLIVEFFNGTNFSYPVFTDIKRSEEFASVPFPITLPWKFGEGSYVYVFFGYIKKYGLMDERAFSESWVGKL